MKHSNVLTIAIVTTIALTALLSPGSSGFAQGTFPNQVVQGVFGPRTMGQPTLAPLRMLNGNVAIAPNGQPLDFGRARGGALSGSSVGWPFGAMGPPGLYPTPSVPTSMPGVPILGAESGFAAVAAAPGGALYSMQLNGTLFPGAVPGVQQPVTGTPPETQGAQPGMMPYGSTTNVPGQNAPNVPGQNASNMPGQNGPNTPGQNSPSGPAGTPGQTAPAAANAAPATPAMDFVPRIPAPWTLGSAYIGGPPSGVAVPSASLTARLENAKQIQKRSPISVTLQGDTAVIRGRVATEHDRDLAAGMLQLEPGVGQVKNELVVESPPPPAQGVSAR